MSCQAKVALGRPLRSSVLVTVFSGTGMSEAELERNPVLTDFSVRDLNKEPKLPYEDNTFDVITNVVSVDYLNKPLVSSQACLPNFCLYLAASCCIAHARSTGHPSASLCHKLHSNTLPQVCVLQNVQH